MRLLVYASKTNEAAARLLDVVQRRVSDEELEVYRTIQGLGWRLIELSSQVGVVILLASDRTDLLGLVSIRELLIDHRIILVLPDCSNDNVAYAHSLRPRYLSYADGSFADVALVLGKMLSACPSSMETARRARFPARFLIAHHGTER